MPDLRQLHNGVPDLLLYERRGRHRPQRRSRPAVAELGVLLRPGLLVSARRSGAGLRREPVPPVADAQARYLARPVRVFGLCWLRTVHRLVPGRHRPHRGSGGAARRARRARKAWAPVSTVSTADLAGHAFAAGLSASQVERLAALAVPADVPAGQRLFDEGGPAASLWLIRSGRIALDLRVPGR